MNATAEAAAGIDLASLADMVVADLARTRRTGRRPDQALERGVELCRRLAEPTPVPGVIASASAGSEATRRQLHGDVDVETKWRRPSAEEIEQLRKAFGRLYETKADIPDDELAQMQEFVVCVTTSSWQERTRDFQQRRLKRALKQQSL